VHGKSKVIFWLKKYSEASSKTLGASANLVNDNSNDLNILKMLLFGWVR